MPVRSVPPAVAKQHYAIDIAGGVAVAAACFGLGLLCPRFSMWVNRQKALEDVARRRGRDRDEQAGRVPRCIQPFWGILDLADSMVGVGSEGDVRCHG